MIKQFLCAFLILVFCAAPALSAEDKGQVIGMVKALQGSAVIANKPAHIEMPVYMHDLIETEDESRLRILFIDETELTLGENALVQVDEYVFMPSEPENAKAKFSIMRGAFLFVSGLISKNENPDVQFDTAYGSIGIRGTEFWGGLLDRAHVYGASERMGGLKDEFGIYVETGEVLFKTNRGKSLVGAGYGTFTKNINSVPTSPKIWSDVDIALALNQIKFSDEN